MRRALALCGIIVLAVGLAGCPARLVDQADTPLKKWAVAQEAHTAATTATAGALQAGVIDLATAKDMRDKLDWAQEALDYAFEEIEQGGAAGEILPLIQRALVKINEVLAETEGG